MNKIISITLSILMIASTMILCVGAVNDQDLKMKPISMTVYDPETGEETQEIYYFNSSNTQVSSCSHEASSLIDANKSVNTYSSLNNEFINAGLTKVTNTTQLPYSAIGQYVIPVTQEYSTAFMISNNVAATAAHVLYDRENHKWKKSGNFYPGKNGLGISNNPFGYAYSRKWAVCTEYINSDPKKCACNYDWGAVVLSESIGNKCGKLSISNLQPYQITLSSSAITSGYPQSSSSLLINYYQYKKDVSIKSASESVIYANGHSKPGQSGSPLLINNSVCGILSSSYSRDDGSKETHYAKIGESAYYYLTQFIAENA